MGYWKQGKEVLGDGPADIMHDAVKRVIKAYWHDIERPPTKNEVKKLLAFVLTEAFRR